MTSIHDNDLDVIIVGGGWSGLMACKYCLAEGLTPLVIEQRDRIGGVWAYTDDTRYAGVMKNTRTTSSRSLTEMSDFPMPADYPSFPSHGQVHAYLEDYCAQYSLRDRVLLNQTVRQIDKVGDTWRVTTDDGVKRTARHVIIASGVHGEPNDMSRDERFSGYSGVIAHSAAYKSISTEFAGKSVLVWGGGETASDVAFELSRIAAQTYFCIPNGQWFLHRQVDRWPPFPSVRPKVADHTSSRLRMFLSPTHQYSPFLYQYIEYAFGFNGHGIKPWRTAAPYHRAFFNKSAEVLDQVKAGKVTPKRDVERCAGTTVFFTDGASATVDHIILCSGYRSRLPAFGDPVQPGTDQRNWFKYIFYDPDPSLAFVGFARPIIGSIPGLAELQSRYVAKVFAGRLRLPKAAERRATIAADAAFWNHHFRYTSLRLSGLVDHFLYSNQIARLIGCYPNFRSLFRIDLRRWWRAVTAPWNGCRFWLNDREHWPRIFATYQRYDDNMVSQNYMFIALAPVLPLIGLWTRTRIALRDLRRAKARRSDRSRCLSLPRGESGPVTEPFSDPA